MKTSFTILFWALGVISLFAQHSLQSKYNMFRPGDKIFKQQMAYTPVGADGKHVLWDFSRLATVDDFYPLIYHRYDRSNPDLIAGWEHRTHYFFKQDDHSILHTGYRNHSVSMAFETPEIQMVFPLHYGDTLSAPFLGNGYYNGEMPLIASGHTCIKADGLGTLITPSNDTLKNVMRIKRTRTYTEVGVENSSMRMETHLWYAPGYRYPIFETTKSFAIINGEEKEDLTIAFYYPPAWMETLEDPENEAIRTQHQQGNELLSACLVVPNPTDMEFSVHFELSAAANVAIKLYNPLGLPISSLPQCTLPEGQHIIQYSAAGLSTGNYLLYIQANDCIRKLVVIKK